MYGIQLFPTDPKKVNLSLAKRIAKKFKLRLGYQDHSNFDYNGYALPAAAIGNGIDIIEKHVTDENKKIGLMENRLLKLKILKASLRFVIILKI